ncbi:flagellar biosynthesis anti-sigma factor FlgM [uncultured Microbulbifer sp.]|uniref:flagellar biosynthesis anti-sigma factor FlgM n=1 Tax=uncultured Microbulbifer sp. TaxID=348147 RepID=UPI0026156995|nr:flagellar biosynthesis anti-sigma factor FlgM [uncultured Microbulbifer sp.]
MKIQNMTQLTPASTLREKPASGPSESVQTTGQPGAPSNITQLHQPTADSSQDIDAPRVEELREAIASGKFDIRADRIAEGLIASLQEQTSTGEP